MKHKPTGLYMPDGGFVRFSETTQPEIGRQIATRATAQGFNNFYGVLPNPDPVLRKLGKSIQVYRDLRSDGHIGGCIRRRKAAVKGLQRGIGREQASNRITKNIEAIFADLDLERIISEILDASLYGYQPLEVVWGKVGGMLVPVDVIGKPAEWFLFDDENRLRFRSTSGDSWGDLLPDRKFLLPRQDASYDNPYGQPDLSRCFWPTKFKQGGTEFWFKFIEKYGTPWLIGKNPRSTPDHETERLLDMLEEMVQDAVAVIPDDSSVEIVEAAGKAASGDVFECFLKYQRSEVSIALLGQNQTTEADVTNASAQAGLEVSGEIRDADGGMVVACFNELISWITDLNFNGEPPIYAMWEAESINKLQAERDQKLKQAGANFTNQYFLRAYNLQPGDLADTPVPDPGAADFSEGMTFPDQQALDDALDALPATTNTDMVPLLQPLFQRIKDGATPDELLGMLAELYPDMDSDGLQERLARAIFVATLWGRLNA